MCLQNEVFLHREALAVCEALVTDDLIMQAKEISPPAERLLESGLSSGDWAGLAAHDDLSQV